MSRCPICATDDIVRRPEKLRDSDTIGVLSCRNCRHIFLDNFDHVDEDYYVAGAIFANKPHAATPGERRRHYRHENDERLQRLAPLITNKRVLDFGCGNGQLLEMAGVLVKSIEGVEPTQVFRDDLATRGVVAKPSLEDCEGPFDVIYSFHVLEHVADPVATLSELGKLLAPGGMIYVEVPNANSALISLYQQAEAQRFHYFLNHLHYFCRSSMAMAVNRSGLAVEVINGHQRFSLANHLYWLSHGKPNGHTIWSFLDDAQLVAHYNRALAAADLSDSLVAQIRRPA